MKVCIAGGGKVGMYLAQSLLAHHHKVTIEPQESLCRAGRFAGHPGDLRRCHQL